MNVIPRALWTGKRARPRSFAFFSVLGMLGDVYK